ncbi:MAG: hypothetical protein CVU05_02910 [Bacteroidetes bacterium HGW-Bacteroidetes-21]|jgi:putative component of membrane protein insertase Oxa1/YidC/SpoIIIJ protein YidD|nr:MAG: hypothetical protein CVU05_02910 [Bacteroidetes bacterium HGW-Bacteroidetes-21]
MIKVTIFVLILFTVVFAKGQNSAYEPNSVYLQYYNVNPKLPIDSLHNIDYRVFGNHDNLLFKPFNFLLWFYKNTISDQLSSDCDFSPSCSRFSYQAIHEFGVLRGIILTADRLTRCNGYAGSEASHFLIDNQHAKVIDRPADYRVSE